MVIPTCPVYGFNSHPSPHLYNDGNYRLLLCHLPVKLCEVSRNKTESRPAFKLNGHKFLHSVRLSVHFGLAFHSNALKGHDPAVFHLADSPQTELYVNVLQISAARHSQNQPPVKLLHREVLDGRSQRFHAG
jgi:hypothetical protein